MFRGLSSFVRYQLSHAATLKLISRIGAQVLSHYCELFPQVSSWLLFIIGCFNIIAVSFFVRCVIKLIERV
jgi:hypothetical protein